MKIAHRDLKPENILFMSESCKVKLGDFTIALEVPDDDFLV